MSCAAFRERAVGILLVHSERLPGYRFVELYRVAEGHVDAGDRAKRIVSQQREILETLLPYE